MDEKWNKYESKYFAIFLVLKMELNGKWNILNFSLLKIKWNGKYKIKNSNYNNNN